MILLRHNLQAQMNNNLHETIQAIGNSNNIYFQAFAKGGSSIFIDRYASDTCIMAPQSTSVCGPNAALECFRMAYYQTRVEEREVHHHADLWRWSGLENVPRSVQQRPETIELFAARYIVTLV